MPLNVESRLPQGDEWSAWIDLAAHSRPRYIGTEEQVKREYGSDPDWLEMYIEDPNGTQYAWNRNTKEWDEL